MTIEDDEALLELQFAEPALRILEAESADVVIARPAAARGPIVVRYAVAFDVDPDEGSPRPIGGVVYVHGQPVGELRWSSEDTSSRTLRLSANGSSGTQPDKTIYVALADVSGTLRDGNEWKVARITVADNPALSTPPPPPPTPSPPLSGPRDAGGAGGLSPEALLFLALALLFHFGMRLRNGPIDRAQLARYSALVIGFLFALGVAPPAKSEPGDLDVRFGTHGQTEIPGQLGSAALIPLPDGRILVFGLPEDLAARKEGAIGVARLLANGQPDPTFGSGGHLDLRLGSESQPVPTDALLLADGRLLVAGYFAGAGSAARSNAPGWLVRLSPEATIDPTFGVGGVARAGAGGIDRIALLADGAIVAAATDLLQRLEPTGAPAPFPGSEVSAVAVGSSYVSAMLPLSDGGVIASSGWNGWDNFLVLARISPSGERVRDWSASGAVNTFTWIDSFATDGDGARLLACGSASSGIGDVLLVQRWQNDGQLDPTFSPDTGGRVELGVETRPGFGSWRWAQCRTLLRDSDDGYLVVGDWNRSREYGGGRVLLARLDVSGALDTTLDPTGRGREVALGAPDEWSDWYVTDAALASERAVLVLAQRERDKRTFITRVEISPSPGAGAIGFNGAAARIAERRPGDLRVYRSGGTAGPISVRYELLHDTTDAADVASTGGTLTWPDGDASPRTIPLAPVDDAAMEGEERFRVRLSEATGDARLGVPEIEVTIEDDEALRALQFAGPEPRVPEGQHADITIARPAATRGPIVVRYALAPDLDPDDGAPKPAQHTRIANYHVGELRWNGDDTSSRTLRVSPSYYGLVDARPDDTIYVALADVSGTLRDGADWKVARITVVDKSALSTAPPPPPTPSPPPSRPRDVGGGGAISPKALLILALALLLNFGRAISRRRSTKANAA